MWKCWPSKILLILQTKIDSFRCSNEELSYLRHPYLLIQRHITIHNRSHEPDCDIYGNKNKKDKKQLVKNNNNIIVSNYLKKLLIGDKTLVNIIERLGDANLLMHLVINSLSSVQEKSLSNQMKNICTKPSKQIFERHFSSHGLHIKNCESMYEEINTDKRNTEIVPKNKLQDITKKLTNVQLEEDIQKLHPSPDVNANGSKILMLNDKNFRSITSKYRLVLVMFYAPWCKYCNDIKPLIRRVAKELPKGVGWIAFCNAEESTKVALEHNVYVYPTLKLFREGKYLKDYEGPRRSLELLKFIVNNSKPDYND